MGIDFILKLVEHVSAICYINGNAYIVLVRVFVLLRSSISYAFEIFHDPYTSSLSSSSSPQWFISNICVHMRTHIIREMVHWKHTSQLVSTCKITFRVYWVYSCIYFQADRRMCIKGLHYESIDVTHTTCVWVNILLYILLQIHIDCNAASFSV